MQKHYENMHLFDKKSVFFQNISKILKKVLHFVKKKQFAHNLAIYQKIKTWSSSKFNLRKTDVFIGFFYSEKCTKMDKFQHVHIEGNFLSVCNFKEFNQSFALIFVSFDCIMLLHLKFIDFYSIYKI